jgi:lipocalin
MLYMLMTVRNTMTTDSPDSDFTSVRALALHRTSLSNQQGVFQLLMGEDEAYTKADAAHDFNTCIGNYRVVALGDWSERTGKYAWAVVSTPFKTSMFIIARNVKVIEAQSAVNFLMVTVCIKWVVQLSACVSNDAALLVV